MVARTLVTVSKAVPMRSLTGHPRDTQQPSTKAAAQESHCEEAPGEPQAAAGKLLGAAAYLSHLELTAGPCPPLHRPPGTCRQEEG